jgi:hypothetical protein
MQVRVEEVHGDHAAAEALKSFAASDKRTML